MVKENTHISSDASAVGRQIVKPAIKRNFVCDNCGTEFNVLQYKCEYRQTGLNEYHYTYSCPECHDTCYSYKEAK